MEALEESERFANGNLCRDLELPAVVGILATKLAQEVSDES